MGEATRRFDWSSTPLGPVDGWPAELKSAAALVLENRFPAALIARNGLVTLHNDAFLPILGDKPGALGRSFADVWAEAWHEIGPLAERALRGQATFIEAYPLVVDRGRGDEHAYFTFSYSPVRDATGAVIGFMDTVIEVTESVRAEAALRESETRQAYLLKLTDAISCLVDAEHIRSAAAEVLGRHLGTSRVVYAEHDGDEHGCTVDRIYVDGFPDAADRDRYAEVSAAVLSDLQAGRTWIRPDIAKDVGLTQAQKSVFAAQGIGASMNVPLVKEGRLVAFIEAHFSTPRHFQLIEIELVRETAERTWAAVERARAEAALRKSEEQFRRSVEEAPIPVIMHADDGEVLQISRSWTELTGYTIEDSAVIQDWLTRAYGLGGETLRGAMKGAFATSGGEPPMRGVIFEITSRRGEQRWWSFSASSPGTLDDGRRFIIGMADDVTERLRAEQGLGESEARFRTLTEAIEDVFYVSDLDAGRLDYLSPAYETIWGRPVAELTADLSRFLDTIHPDDRAEVEANRARQARGEPVHSEYRIVRPDGEVRWILDRCFPIPDQRRLSAGVASDITRRKAVEAALSEGEERLRRVVEGARDYAIFTLDAEARVVDWYAGAEAVFGFSADEIRGQAVGRLYLPEDLAKGEDEKELAQARATGSAPNVRWHARKDGGHVFIDGYVTRLDGPDGSLRGYLKIGQDVSERRRGEERLRESEGRFRTLVEGIPQLVWRAGEPGLWTWASPQWKAFTGQAHRDSHGWGWLNCVHPDDRQGARDAWARAKETGQFQADYRVREAATGGYRFVQTRATAVRDEVGEIVEWLGASTDVQDMKEMQDRQAVLVAELQHRTRNLMAVVRSVFDKSRRGSEGVEALSATYGHRLGALARAQGLLSRLDGGDRVSFDALVRIELSAMGAIDAQGRGERVVLDGPVGVRLRSSTVQVFALALHELATNASKYGALAQPNGRLSVRWRLLEDEEDAPRLRIEWVETGVGMPGEEGPRRTGYGRELIERALPYQLGATTTYVIGADGVKCTIELPILEAIQAKEAVDV